MWTRKAKTHPKGAPLSPIDRHRLAAHVNRVGVKVVLAATGVTRNTLAAAMGGLPVNSGTVALCQRGLERLDRDALRAKQAAELARDSGGLS